MAFELAKTAPDGSVRTYHRIVNVQADLVMGEFLIQVGSYRDRDARGVAKAFYAPQSYTAEAADIPDFDLEGNLVALLYGWLKTLPEWEEANDV